MTTGQAVMFTFNHCMYTYVLYNAVKRLNGWINITSIYHNSCVYTYSTVIPHWDFVTTRQFELFIKL